MNLSSLKRFLIEKCDPDVAHQLITWIHSDEAKHVIEHEFAAYEEKDLAINSDKIYQKIITTIRKEESGFNNETLEQFGPGNDKRPKIWKRLSIAASILALLVSGILFYVMDYFETEPVSSYATEDIYLTKTAELGQKLTVQLSDGSRVKLNAGSSITYNTTYGENRIVELEGEAFFDVVRDESRPFIVRVKNMQVRVLGTSFNINAKQSENIGVVAVKSGNVEVKNVQSGLLVMLTKDEVGRVTGNQNILKSHVENPEEVFGWTENKLVFNNSNVREVLSKVTNWFGYTIDMKINISTLDNFTGVYENPTLKEVLESLSYSYKFDYEISDKKIVIK